MWDSLSRGCKCALLTLAVELVLALALVSDALAIFAMLAMVFVGVAWLPSAIVIFSDLRREPEPHALGFLIAILCGTIGTWCLFFSFKSIALAVFFG